MDRPRADVASERRALSVRWPGTGATSPSPASAREREFFIGNLLVRIHFVIVMIRWTGLAPCEFEFPFPGSLTSTSPQGNIAALAWHRRALPLSRIRAHALYTPPSKKDAPNVVALAKPLDSRRGTP